MGNLPPADVASSSTGPMTPESATQELDISPSVTEPAVTDIAAIPGLADLWEETQGDPSVCIAVLDGPVDLTHPAFAGADLTQLMTPGLSANVTPLSDHGTQIASIIFGQHGSPVTGIAPNCRGLLIPIFDYAEDGSLLPSSQETLARAIRTAVAYGANVINISAGEFARDGQPQDALASAVDECKAKAVVVAAAGNDGCNCLHVPGALPSVLTVGAMGPGGEPLEFSNWGDSYRGHGILAPGQNIRGAARDAGTTVVSGTSFATAIASGVAGLLLSSRRDFRHQPTPQSVHAALLSAAVGCEVQPTEHCERLLAGRLDISSSHELIRNQTIETTMNMTSIEQNAGVAASTCSVNGRQGGAPASAPETVTPTTTFGSGVNAAGCGCQTELQLAYPIGELGYRFGSDASRESIQYHMDEIETSGLVRSLNVDAPIDLLRHLLGFSEIKVTLESGIVGKAEIDGGRRIIITSLGSPSFTTNDRGRFVELTGLLERVKTNGTPPPYKMSKYNGHSRIIPHGSNGQFRLQRKHPVAEPIVEFEPEKARWYLPRKCTTTTVHEPNIFDADSLIWILGRGRSDQYAVRPEGSFSEDSYRDLAETLMRANGLTAASLDFYYCELDGVPSEWPFNWDPCINSTDCCFSDPKRCCDDYRNTKVSPTILREPQPDVERVALPGIVGGQVQERDGTRLPVLRPSQRGATQWSIESMLVSLVEIVFAESTTDPTDEQLETLKTWLSDLLSRLDEQTRNNGMTSSDRALNFASVQLQSFTTGFLRRLIGHNAPEKIQDTLHLDDILTPTRNDNCPSGRDCWDVEIAFFNPEKSNEAKHVVRQTIDVTDVAPVLIDQSKFFRRR